MGRSPCCDKVGLKKGPWTPEEDQKLLAYIEENGHGSWRALPAKAGLQRCGKSCRLRWTNYLRPDIKRGKFSLQEEQTIIQLHALLGNRWSAIATHLPKRTDNEIKNYWNTHLKKRLAKMGIDPVTHKPKNDALLSVDGPSKNAANLSHMAQWESARLEAEARLVRESKLRNSHSIQHHHHQLISSTSCTTPAAGYASASSTTSASTNLAHPARSLDILKSWNGIGGDLESPTSTLTFSESAVPPIMNSTTSAIGESTTSINIPITEFVGSTSGNSSESRTVKDEGGDQHVHEWKRGLASSSTSHMPAAENSVSFTSGLHEMTISMEAAWNPDHQPLRTDDGDDHVHVGSTDHVMEEAGFTSLLLGDSGERRSLSTDNGKDINSDNSPAGCSGSDDYEDNKNYWNSILNLVNSSPSSSPMF